MQREESAFDNFYKQFVSLDTEATIDNNLNNEHQNEAQSKSSLASSQTKPYSDRFIIRFNGLLERIILNNRRLTTLEVSNFGSEKVLHFSR